MFQRSCTYIQDTGVFIFEVYVLLGHCSRRQVSVKIGGNLQKEFQYDFQEDPREISAGTVITVLKTIMHVNTVNTVPAEISR